MFRHNFFLAFRNFKKSKSSFFINLIGLSTGLTCTLLIYLWVNDELMINKFHEKDDRLYQVMENQQYAEGLMTTSSTPGILSEALAEEFPDIEYAATTTWVGKFTLTYEETNLKADGFYVGKDYFNIFTFPLIYGQEDQVLTDKNSIVISDELALKLFPSIASAVGKTIEFQHQDQFIVTGVFEKVPEQSTYKFDFVLPFEKFKDDNEWVTSWGNNGPPTFVILHEGINHEGVTEKIKDFVKEKNDEDESNVTLFLKKYSDNYLYGKYENGHQVGGRIEYVKWFSVIAIFILLIACINFMNLSTAKASKRAREVGVKKAIGAHQNSLIVQFLSESLILTFLALLVAIIMVWAFLPQFNEITDKHIQLEFNATLVTGLLTATIITGLVSGSYPALYLANFAPVKVLKGEIRTSAGELWARRGLVIVQFFLSILLIVSVIVVYKQIEFVQNKNLGYDKDNVIFFEIEGKVEGNEETFINEVKKIPGVLSASSIGHSLLGQQNNTSGLDWPGKNPDDRILFENMRVNHDLIETMGINVIEGRAFSRDFSTDSTKIIFNQAGIKVMGLENPVGQVINLWEEYDLEIIGVVEDFHFQSLHEEVNPLFMWLSPRNTWNIVVRIEAGQEKETINRLTEFYTTYNPGFVFDYRFQDVEYAKQYAAEQRVSQLSRYFALMAIVISCLGLFGLASFTAERRQKEIGIRKVLGCSNFQIVYLLSSDFSKMVFVSMVFAIPISYYFLDSWLQRFVYRIDLEIWFFALAGLLALFVAWVTISSQALRAANTNPVDCLKDE